MTVATINESGLPPAVGAVCSTIAGCHVATINESGLPPAGRRCLIRSPGVTVATINESGLPGYRDDCQPFSGYPFAVSAAAFLDLDRTLLHQASGPVLSQALREMGVLSESRIPSENLLFGVFDPIGGIRPSMMSTEQGVCFSKGRGAELVAQAVVISASRLVTEVLPYARTETAMPRKQGKAAHEPTSQELARTFSSRHVQGGSSGAGDRT